MASLLLWCTSPDCTLTPSYGCGCSGTDVPWLELCPCNLNEGKAIGILQKAAQFCLWCHQLMLKMVMEVGRWGNLLLDLRHCLILLWGCLWTYTPLLLLIHCCGSVDTLWFLQEQELAKECADLSAAHSVSAWSRVSLVLPWLWL